MNPSRSLVESYFPYDRDRLPTWYTHPEPDEAMQRNLFAPPPDELESVLVTLHISVDDLSRWHEHGWISFNSAIDERVEQGHVNELRFVRDVVRSGLSDAQIAALLDDLPRPMNFDPAMVAFSFSFGWVEAVPPTEPEVSEFVEEHLDEWLEGLAESDPERLVRLRDRLDGMISSLEVDDEQGASDSRFPEAER